MNKPNTHQRAIHRLMTTEPTRIEYSVTPCPKCGGTALHVNLGKCVGCHKLEKHKKYPQPTSRMQDIERLREDRELERLSLESGYDQFDLED